VGNGDSVRRPCRCGAGERVWARCCSRGTANWRASCGWCAHRGDAARHSQARQGESAGS